MASLPMADLSSDFALAVGLGQRTLDSHEVRKKQQIKGSTTIATPPSYSDLCPDVRDTPPVAGSDEGMTFYYKPKPRFEQSNVYPQRSNPKADLSVGPGPSLPRSPSSQTPTFGPHSPTKISPSRKLLQVFQEAKECVISKDRVSSLIQTLEEEMQKFGVTVKLSELRNQLHNVQDLQTTSDERVEFVAGGDLFDSNAPNQGPVQLTKQPVLPPPLPKAKDWGSLFKAQSPSTGCESPYMGRHKCVLAVEI